MATDDKWYFTKEQLANSPSRKYGIDADKELSYRQQAANFIQDMGQKLNVSQLCINTAIVYMHRFYVFHSLSLFHRNSIAVAAIFLAAKVEEQPRKLEHVIKVAHTCLHRDPNFDVKSEQYQAEAQDLVFNESILLQTLGFKVAIDHPHTHVVKCCQLVKASKDLAQTSYFMASNSLHLTTMCLRYKPTVVACFCIHLACKWSNWEIPQSKEGKDWFWYVDSTVTAELLTHLTGEFLHIFDKCPSRLKKKIMQQQNQQSPQLNHLASSPFDVEPRKIQGDGSADCSFGFSRFEIDSSKKMNSSSSRQHVDYHREKRERDKTNQTAAHADPNKHHSYHHKQTSSSANMPNKHLPSTAPGMKPSGHPNHHTSSRPDMKPFAQFPAVQNRHPANNYNSSSSSQSRDRQRIAHGHPMNNSLDSSVNYALEPSTVHPTEKLSNNLHKPHNDLRHSKQQQQQKDVKLYPKGTDPARVVRKSDNLDQRNEEMKKVMEKPAPPPKPRAEVIQEERASMMLKQSHYPSKYGHQPEKPPLSVNSTSALPMSESKMLNVGQTAFTNKKSPNAPVSASQIPHKPLTNLVKAPTQMPLVKNGTSSSLGLINNLVDSNRQSSPVLPVPAALPSKHRSLFSPEKTLPSSKESWNLNQRMKQKPKSSPALPKEQDLSFSNSNSQPVTTDLMLNKQKDSNTTSVLPRKHHGVHNLETNFDQPQHQPQQQQQQNVDHRKLLSNAGSKEVQGFGGNSLPDLSRAIRENSFDNKSMITNLTNELKPTGIVKPMNSINQMMMANNQQQKQQHHSLNNGFDMPAKREYSTVDPSIFDINPELPDEILSTDMPSDLMFMKPEPQVNDILSFTDSTAKSEQRKELDLKAKPENFSPMKSAQGISALLQETLTPMPSLLKNIPDYEQQERLSNKQDYRSMQSYNQGSAEPSLPSTVDMSALAPSNCNEMSLPVTTTPSVMAPIVIKSNELSVPSNDNKSEHRSKGEKKKKKEKHKNKDKEKEKDKSKEKHKNKHKDKDKSKEKHRDKSNREKDKTESGGSSGYASSGVSVPIKITIAKEMLKHSSETSASSTPSGLKIKIPKDRFKNSEVPLQPTVPTQRPPVTAQAPLKLKIRTDALVRGVGTESHQDQSRKRERSDFIDEALVDEPLTKRHQQSQLQQFQQLQQHQQQQQQRQNGRHNLYNAGSNNKVRGGGRGVDPRLPPYPYQQYALGQPNYRGYHHQQQCTQSQPQLRLPRPPPAHPPLHHPYFTNYPSAAAMQNPIFSGGYTGNMFDSMYYQYQQQPPQFPMYPTGNMSQIDTSVPPPSLGMPQVLGQNSEKENAKFVGDADVSQPPPPPLPSGPPPDSIPPPPPPPE